MSTFSEPPPLSLYIHLPWCEKKCPYCDFNSHVRRRPIPETEYVCALLMDLDAALASAGGRTLKSIYLGGGTPSLFGPESLRGLLAGIHARVAIEPRAEVTLEANPGSAEMGKFQAFRDAGVNRLSIGVQSFNGDKLASLGRIHGPDEALRAADAARRAGFSNFNLDLMFGLPGQTVDEALDDVQTAIAQGPSHLSCYQLTIEPGTGFHRRPPRLPDHDRVWEMQEGLAHRLACAGYAQYEVSAYARPQAQCRHNRNYWEYGDYLGIGAGAHSKVTTASEVLRWQRPNVPDRYLRSAAATPLTRASRIHGAALDFEFMLNALRLKDGVSARTFVARTGRTLEHLGVRLSELRRRGWLRTDTERLVTTELGYRFLDDVVRYFLPAPRASTPGTPAARS